MNKPHKHAAFIKAWADGAEIEFYDYRSGSSGWKATDNPQWLPDVRYRVKPEPQKPVEFKLSPVDQGDQIASERRTIYVDENGFLKLKENT